MTKAANVNRDNQQRWQTITTTTNKDNGQQPTTIANNKDQQLTNTSKYTTNNAIINLATTINKGDKRQRQGMISAMDNDDKR